MAAWRMAKSLEVLREQINAQWPGRSKASDGGKGDDAHAKRKSDHNPNAKGIVCARDFTDDDRVGFDATAFCEALIAGRDTRVDYIISDGTIISGPGGPRPWQRRKYNGPNKHNHHIHISVRDDLCDGTAPWDFLRFMTIDKRKAAKAPTAEMPTLSRGTKGTVVEEIQRALNAKGAKPQIKVDGDFGERTERAVKAFQKANGLFEDGKVGAYTREKLGI